jgi:hypothetical protein
LLAHIDGRSLSLGDIRHVLAAKQILDKGKNQMVNASESTRNSQPWRYNKGETNTFIGQHNSAHVTMLHYSVVEHDVASMEKAFVDHGANGGI